MANTKISSLTAVSGNGAATNEFIIADGTTVNKKTTLQKIVDFILTRANTFSAIQTMSAQFRQANGADIASAATVDLSAATGNSLTITGSTGPITSFGTVQAGTLFVLTFASTPTITHNATSLILPNAANIVAAAGDVMALLSLGSGNWRCASYSRAARPSFSVHRNSVTQAIANATLTKVQWTTEEFDTNSNFDVATNYRFTPTVSGKYILSAAAQFTDSVDTAVYAVSLYKNGVEYKRGPDAFAAQTGTKNVGSAVNAIVDANGSTDYFEVFVYQDSGGSVNLSGEPSHTYFTGAMV